MKVQSSAKGICHGHGYATCGKSTEYRVFYHSLYIVMVEDPD